MQQRTRKALSKFALCAIVGIAPLAYLFLWWGNPTVVEPLTAPITVQNGQYISPSYATYVADQYQIELYFLPFAHAPVDIAWKIVSDHGAVLATGEYKEEHTGGNDAILGHYRSARWSHQKIILNTHQDPAQPAFETTLHIGIPERTLAMADGGIVLALAWAALISCIGLAWIVIDLRRNRVPRSAVSA